MSDGKDPYPFMSVGMLCLIRSDKTSHNIWLHHNVKCLHNKVKNGLMNYITIFFVYLSCESSIIYFMQANKKFQKYSFLYSLVLVAFILSVIRYNIIIFKCVGLRRASTLTEKTEKERGKQWWEGHYK